MPTNDFLPFATAGGANVLSQATYSGEAARLAGVVAGTAKSSLANKSWRQSGSIAAMIGQFIADHSGLDALDDGNIAVLLERFESAIRHGDLNYVPTIGGTANALTAALDPVPASYTEITGSRFLIVPSATNTAAATINFNGLGAIAIQRPDGSALKPGDIVSGQPVIGFVFGGAFRLMSVAKQDAKGLRYKATGTNAIAANVSSSPTFLSVPVRNDFSGSPWNAATSVYTAQQEGWHDAAVWLQCASADRFLVKLETTSGTAQTMQNRDTAPTADVADRVVLVSGNFYLTLGQTLALTCIQESSGSKSLTNGEISIYYSPT